MNSANANTSSSAAAESPDRAPRGRETLLIAALGVAQIVSWGTLYYSFSLFVLPMQESLGWSLTQLNGALTTGLLVAGVCAFPVGAYIDRHGGRALMTAGALGAVALLCAWSQVETLTAFYAVWFGLGACMAAVLYEPLFVVLTYHFKEHARRAITTLTLVAGFASTVFMPLIETLLGHLPWRDVLLILALIYAAITVPVHALLIPPRTNDGAHTAGPAEHGAARAYLRTRLGDPTFWGLTIWFTAYIGTASGLMFQLVPYLKANGVTTAIILLTIALVGPSQVAGRLLLMLAGDRASTIAVGAATTTLTPLAVLLLILAPGSMATLGLFAVMFGVANGVTTILRGVAPAEWLGRAHYGSVMGVMGAPMMIAAALAPLLTAAIWTASGSPQTMQWAVLAVALLGAAGFWLAVCTREPSTD
ncbi:MAG: MFS transporter [Gammaproteobacteria bacterium]